MQVSQQGIDNLMISDFVDITGIISADTPQNQVDALTSLASDIGLQAFVSSTILKKHNSRCYSCASLQFPVWGERTGDKEKRRKEREIYFYGYQ